LVAVAIVVVVWGDVDGEVAAQTIKATISGLVTDGKGAASAGARITARNLDTNLSRETTSDDAGRYRIPELVAGQYELTAVAKGFRPRIHRGIDLSVGRVALVDLLLNAGGSEDEAIIEMGNHPDPS
jgi:Carboxypeptidase regulatory-like domain